MGEESGTHVVSAAAQAAATQRLAEQRREGP